MKNLMKSISMLFLLLFAGHSLASLDQFQANFVDEYYDWGWPREYSAYLYEFEANDFMHDNAATHVINHFGTEYINSDNLIYLFYEASGNFKGSNEITRYYSHDVYQRGFTKPIKTENSDPGYCEWAGWTPGQTDGGYAWGGSIYLYGEYNFMVDFVERHLKSKTSPDILYAWKNNCFPGNGHFAILMIPYLNVVKLHNPGE